MPKTSHAKPRRGVKRYCAVAATRLHAAVGNLRRKIGTCTRDSRAYAAWAGKRLPHEWEWQYAAQGKDHRDYPWGNEWVPANAPAPDRGRIELPPSNVQAHPSGASPFGVQDLVGNVWQWTDEWTDQHTRAAILRGGSHYQPTGSQWYFPQAYKLSQHGKYLLMAPSLDRSASIGFRCVMDAAQ